MLENKNERLLVKFIVYVYKFDDFISFYFLWIYEVIFFEVFCGEYIIVIGRNNFELSWIIVFLRNYV